MLMENYNKEFWDYAESDKSKKASGVRAWLDRDNLSNIIVNHGGLSV
jgi:hypothetical protein